VTEVVKAGWLFPERNFCNGRAMEHAKTLPSTESTGSGSARAGIVAGDIILDGETECLDPSEEGICFANQPARGAIGDHSRFALLSDLSMSLLESARTFCLFHPVLVTGSIWSDDPVT
jgi:hypothetical protein